MNGHTNNLFNSKRKSRLLSQYIPENKRAKLNLLTQHVFNRLPVECSGHIQKQQGDHAKAEIHRFIALRRKRKIHSICYGGCGDSEQLICVCDNCEEENKCTKMKSKKTMRKRRPNSIQLSCGSSNTESHTTQTKDGHSSTSETYNTFNFWKSPVIDIDETWLNKLGKSNNDVLQSMDTDTEKQVEELDDKFNSFNFWKEPLPVLDVTNLDSLA